MSTALTYVIKFVGDMEESVRFHAEKLNLKLRFQSPEWTEFDTGSTTLALHIASPENTAGSCQIGLGAGDLKTFYATARDRGVEFVSAPEMVHGQLIVKFRDLDGATASVSGS